MTDKEVSFKSLVAELVGDIGDLLRHELRLAQAEVSEKVSRLQVGLVSVALGLICALCAMLILLQAVLGFDNLLYISIESGRVAPAQQQLVRWAGIGLAIAEFVQTLVFTYLFVAPVGALLTTQIFHLLIFFK